MVGHKKTACPNKSKAALCPLPKQEHFYFSKRFSQIFPSDRELACSEFRSMSVEDRVKTCVEHGFCLRCLGRGHELKNCKHEGYTCRQTSSCMAAPAGWSTLCIGMWSERPLKNPKTRLTSDKTRLFYNFSWFLSEEANRASTSGMGAPLLSSFDTGFPKNCGCRVKKSCRVYSSEGRSSRSGIIWPNGWY